MRAISIAAIVVVGCSQAVVLPDPDTLRTVTGTVEQEQYAGEALTRMREFVSVDGSRIDVNFVTTFAEQRDRCGGFAACERAETNGYRIDAYWPSVWTRDNAYDFCHELCHVFYSEDGEDGDPNHLHEECFGRPGQKYVNENGYAWQVAGAMFK